MLHFFQKHVKKYRADHNNILYKSSNVNILKQFRDPLPQNDEECLVAMKTLDESKKKTGLDAIKRKNKIRQQLVDIQEKRKNEKLEAKNRKREAALQEIKLSTMEKATKGELNVIDMDNLLLEALES